MAINEESGNLFRPNRLTRDLSDKVGPDPVCGKHSPPPAHFASKVRTAKVANGTIGLQHEIVDLVARKFYVPKE